MKDLIRKETSDFVLVALPHGQSVIISKKFKRNKEGVDKYGNECIYFSLPRTYYMNVRTTRYNTNTDTWEVVSDERRYPKQVSWLLHCLYEDLQEQKELSEILKYE